jgi:hypothetical protein
MKAQTGSRSIALLVLNLGITLGWVVNNIARLLSPWGSALVSTVQTTRCAVRADMNVEKTKSLSLTGV